MGELLAVTVKSWPLLFVACASFLILGVLLIWVVARLVRSNREQIVATLPLREEQELKLGQPASLLLMVEVPRVGSNFRNLEFEIIEKATGQSARLSYDFARAQGAIYGLTTMRVPIGPVEVPHAGSYLVRIFGFTTSYGRHHQPSPFLQALSWSNGLADHRHRPLRDRSLTQPASRRVAVVRTTTRLSSATSKNRGTFSFRGAHAPRVLAMAPSPSRTCFAKRP